MNKLTIIIIFLCSLFLSSCYNNVIYYDFENGSINTCNGRRIRSLRVLDKDTYFIFELKKGRKGTNKFVLNDVSDDYSVEYSGSLLDIRMFMLTPSTMFRPNRKYTILNRSNGDATSGEVNLETDSIGKVVFADKKNCD